MTTWNRDDSDLSTLTGIASTTVGNLRLTGSTIGHISDTDILTFSANTLDITASISFKDTPLSAAIFFNCSICLFTGRVSSTSLSTSLNPTTGKRENIVHTSGYEVIGEQLDKLWHDIDNGTLDKTGNFYTAIKTVKDKWSKP